MNEEQRKRLEENRASNERAAEKRAQAEDNRQKTQATSRLRESFRDQADRENPNPAAQVLDSHGRPREPSDHHSRIGNVRL